MKKNDFFTHYEFGNSIGGFNIHTYDSLPDFKHRDFFEHKHINFEISIVVEGSGIYRFKDGEYRFKAGDVFVMGSNQVHCVTDIDEGNSMRFFNIQFEPRLFWGSTNSLLNEKHLHIFDNKCQRFCYGSDMALEMGKQILELREETITRKPGFEIKIYAALISLIGAIVRECEYVDIPSYSSSKDFVRIEAAMIYINSHISEKLTLDAIAAVAGYSKNYFCSLFTQLNGLSLWDYIMIKRINISKKLLENEDSYVTDIALRCGYQTITVFNRHFKRLVGCTPTEYARKKRNIV